MSNFFLHYSTLFILDITFLLYIPPFSLLFNRFSFRYNCFSVHCRDMVVPGLIFFSGAKVALRFPCAGPRSVPLFAASPATSATVRPPRSRVRHHLAEVETAVISIYLHLLSGPTGDSLDFDVGRLEKLQGLPLLLKHTRLPIFSVWSPSKRHLEF